MCHFVAGFLMYFISKLLRLSRISSKIEQFLLDKWEDTWVYSEKSGKEFGKFVRTAGKFFNDEEADKGETITN